MCSRNACGIDWPGGGADGQIQGSEVELVRTDGSHTVVLTAADGLQNPASLARRGDTVYIADAAYFTATDPNLLSARLLRGR
ncbi:hypothetical protein ACGF12_28940 [Kitasatospora sp. NPDC048296]|uniref:hypothetical protein n=1 Tax=Kitasatospora sp. NPDC048296 TaxID=3364048 RepID=UPI0037204C56